MPLRKVPHDIATTPRGSARRAEAAITFAAAREGTLWRARVHTVSNGHGHTSTVRPHKSVVCSNTVSLSAERTHPASRVALPPRPPSPHPATTRLEIGNDRARAAAAKSEVGSSRRKRQSAGAERRGRHAWVQPARPPPSRRVARGRSSPLAKRFAPRARPWRWGRPPPVLSATKRRVTRKHAAATASRASSGGSTDTASRASEFRRARGASAAKHAASCTRRPPCREPRENRPARLRGRRGGRRCEMTEAVAAPGAVACAGP